MHPTGRHGTHHAELILTHRMRACMHGIAGHARWYRLSQRQRRFIQFSSVLAMVVLVVAAAVAAPASGQRRQQSSGPNQRLDAGGAAPSDGGSGSSSGSGNGAAPTPAAAGKRTPIQADSAKSPYCSWNQLYLPKIVTPDHYNLRITTDLRLPPYSVEGSVRIALAPVAVATPCIVVHSKGINVTAVRLFVGPEEDGDFMTGG
jgi:hypothetical protein